MEKCKEFLPPATVFIKYLSKYNVISCASTDFKATSKRFRNKLNVSA